MDDSTDLEESECCGSGCNNCVLDVRTKTASKSTKTNILTVDGSTYIKFSLQRKWKCTENVWRFEFSYSNKDELLRNSLELDIPPGSHVMIRVAIDEIDSKRERHDRTTVGNFVSRPYTPIHVDNSNGSFEILVKLEPGGLMSKHLQSISIGEVVEVKGPYRDFKWTPNSVRHLICVSQGVGIAPLYAIVASILNNEDDETWIDFRCCFRSIEDILLRDELYDFRQYWNFQSSIYLSNEKTCSCGDGDANHRFSNCACIRSKSKYNEILYSFRLDETELSKMFLKKEKENCLVLICGTSRFINSIKISMKNLQIKDENVFVFD